MLVVSSCHFCQLLTRMLGEPVWAPGILNWSLTKIDKIVAGSQRKLMQHEIPYGIGVLCYRSPFNIFLLLSYCSMPT
jgi:hypothetical protein